MDAKQYADEVMDPTIAEFENEPRSRRRAFIACLVTFHLIDYIDAQRRKELRQEFRGDCPAFAVVDRVTHAFKHVTTGHPQSPIQPLAAGQVIERPPATRGQAVWDLSLWDDAVGGVTIASEHHRNLLADVKEAAAFLRSKLPS
jgi:hypothetical protein